MGPAGATGAHEPLRPVPRERESVRDLDREDAARDRAAAADDRRQAAQDRALAAAYLHRTYRDALTGALQRAAGHDQLSREVERARRTESPLVVAFLDVVGLKSTNDSAGHAAGDAVLQLVGRRLAEGLRAYDLIVRWGGDEFVCALPATGVAAAGVRFLQIQRRLEDDAIGLSVGLAELGRGDGMQDVVDRADRDLYDKRRAAGAGRARTGGRPWSAVT